MQGSESTKYRFAFWSFGILVFIAILLGSLAAIYKYNNQIPDLKIPTHSVPKDNALDYYVRSSAMLHGLKGPASNVYPFEEWTNAELRYWYREAQPAIAVARMGLTKPCVQPPIRRNGDVDYITAYNRSRETARTLLSASYACYRLGEYGKAADNCFDGAEIGAGFSRGGVVITSLVAYNIFRTGVDYLDEVLPKLNAPELQTAARRLETIKKKVRPWSEVVREEGYSSLASEIQLLKSASPKDMCSTPGWMTPGAFSSPATRPTVTDISEGISFVFRNKRRMVTADQRFYEQLEKEAAEPYGPRSKVIPGSVFASDNIITARATHVTMLAAIEVLRAYVAVLRYHKVTGRYPKTLGKLVPRYLPSVPVDPFGGATRPPLRYRLKGSSFLLYSIGSDLQDDGGKPTLPGRLSTPGDIVAGEMFERYAPPRPKDHKDLPE